MSSQQYFLMLSVVATLGGCTADEEPTSSRPNSRAGDTIVTVQTQEGTFLSTSPAILTATPTSLEFGLTAGSAIGTWAVAIPTLPDAVSQGIISARAIDGVPGLGTATVNRQSTSELTNASLGEVTIRLSVGRFEGEFVNATPSEMEGTLAGRLAVQCWVFKAGSDGNGTVADDGTAPLVLDESLLASHCAPLRNWVQ